MVLDPYDTIRLDLRTFKDRFRKALAGRYFADKSHPLKAPGWAIEDMRRMRQGRLLTDPIDSNYALLASRYEAAIATQAAMNGLRQCVDDLDRIATDVAARGNPPFTGDSARERIVSKDKELASWEGEIVRLVEEFYFELCRLGGDPEGMVGLVDKSCHQLRAFTLPRPGMEKTGFRDVPLNHWAARDVNELKAAGIFLGDGTGRFGG